LITVKTYPTLSRKYDELVCTAGLDEQGNWYRLYPITFRKLEYENQYPKYSWIEVDIEKNPSDPRPESYRPNVDAIKILGKIEADGEAWTERRKIVLKKYNTNLEQHIKEAKDKTIGTSLAVFKAKEILDFTCEQTAREWDSEILEYIKSNDLQLKLFEKSDNPFEVVKKLPFKFSYKFIDDSDKPSRMMIEDWEIGQLYWNCLKSNNYDETAACRDVRKKYFDDFAKTKDKYLFLGTTREFHFVGLNPFIIIGTVHPKRIEQAELDFESERTHSFSSSAKIRIQPLAVPSLYRVNPR